MGILFIIEINPIYNIIYFILITISLALSIYAVGVIYISLILIIVYSTALIILFGFIIMKNKKQLPYLSPSYLSLPLFLLLYLFLFLSHPYPLYSSSFTACCAQNLDLISIIGNILFTDPLFIALVFISALVLLFPILALLYL